MGVPTSPSVAADMKLNIILGCLVSAVLSDSISRIDRVPVFGARPLRQLGLARAHRQLPSPLLELSQQLTPITKRGVLPNFIFLDAEQMPGYEKFGKHEIVRNGKTTESPYLVEYVESIQDYSNLVDERTPNRKD